MSMKHFPSDYPRLIRIGNFAGNSGIRLRAQSSAAAATEASDSSTCAGRHAYPVPVALLRGQRKLDLHCNVDASHGTEAQPRRVSTASPSSGDSVVAGGCRISNANVCSVCPMYSRIVTYALRLSLISLYTGESVCVCLCVYPSKHIHIAVCGPIGTKFGTHMQIHLEKVVGK